MCCQAVKLSAGARKMVTYMEDQNAYTPPSCLYRSKCIIRPMSEQARLLQQHNMSSPRPNSSSLTQCEDSIPLQHWESRPSWDTSYHEQSSRTLSEDTSHAEPHQTNGTLETQAPGNTSRESPQTPTWKRVIRDWWAEMLWLIFSAACLSTVAIGLLIMDGTPLSTWQFSISLNAGISVLMVATKAALIYTTACCIGQLKWHHFQQRHAQSLYDLKTFDEASKGPLGALKLVTRLKSISVVALFSSLVVLCAVFMETFSQQILAYPSRSIVANETRAVFSTTNHLASQPSWYLDYTSVSDLQKLLLAAIFKGNAAPAFECSTASCTWPASSTLGICSSCRDITAASNGSCVGDSRSLDCQYVTPQGFQLGGNVQPGGPMPLINTTTVDGVYNVAPSFYNFSTLVVSESTNWTAKLTECELSWCAWAYENATSTGTDINLVGTRQHALQFVGTWERTNETLNLDDTQSVCKAIDDYPADLNKTFTISQGKEYFLKYAVRLILKAGYQGMNFYTQLTLATSSLDYTDTAAMSSNLAEFMTNALRTQDGTQCRGTAWQWTTFIKVDWVWLILPVVVVLAAMLLLGLTIAQSTRNDTVLWKSSSLAFLFCSAQAWTSDSMSRSGEARSVKDMEMASKTMDARLERNGDGKYQLLQV
jgi:hypothetical protein